MSVLDLAGCALGDGDVSTITQTLQSRPGVSTLLLGDNRISSTALLLLAPQLVAQSALTELDMSHNRFTDSGFVALCQAMVDASNPPPLSHLRVAGNALGTRGTQALAEWLSSTRLKSLDMSNTVSLRPAALESVLRALAPSTASNLCYLDVSGNKLGEAQATLLAAAWRSSARSLRTARASDNNFGVSGITTLAAAIAHCSALTALDLSNTGAADSGASSLASVLRSHANLRSVSLRSCGIQSTGTLAIASALQSSSCSRVTSIDFSFNSAGDSAVSKLSAARPFTRLLLDGTGVSDQSLSVILSATRSSPVIEHLSLGQLTFGPAGSALLVSMLSHGATLSALSFAGANRSVVDILSPLVGKSPLLGLSTVVKIDFSKCALGDLDSARLLENLLPLQTIQFINLDGNETGNQTVQTLCKFVLHPSIESVSIADSNAAASSWLDLAAAASHSASLNRCVQSMLRSAPSEWRPSQVQLWLAVELTGQPEANNTVQQAFEQGINGQQLFADEQDASVVTWCRQSGVHSLLESIRQRISQSNSVQSRTNSQRPSSVSRVDDASFTGISDRSWWHSVPRISLAEQDSNIAQLYGAISVPESISPELPADIADTVSIDSRSSGDRYSESSIITSTGVSLSSVRSQSFKPFSEEAAVVYRYGNRTAERPSLMRPTTLPAAPTSTQEVSLRRSLDSAQTSYFDSSTTSTAVARTDDDAARRKAAAEARRLKLAAERANQFVAAAIPVPVQRAATMPVDRAPPPSDVDSVIAAITNSQNWFDAEQAAEEPDFTPAMLAAALRTSNRPISAAQPAVVSTPAPAVPAAAPYSVLPSSSSVSTIVTAAPKPSFQAPPPPSFAAASAARPSNAVPTNTPPVAAPAPGSVSFADRHTKTFQPFSEEAAVQYRFGNRVAARPSLNALRAPVDSAAATTPVAETQKSLPVSTPAPISAVSSISPVAVSAPVVNAKILAPIAAAQPKSAPKPVSKPPKTMTKKEKKSKSKAKSKPKPAASLMEDDDDDPNLSEEERAEMMARRLLAFGWAHMQDDVSESSDDRLSAVSEEVDEDASSDVEDELNDEEPIADIDPSSSNLDSMDIVDVSASVDDRMKESEPPTEVSPVFVSSTAPAAPSVISSTAVVPAATVSSGISFAERHKATFQPFSEEAAVQYKFGNRGPRARPTLKPMSAPIQTQVQTVSEPAVPNPSPQAVVRVSAPMPTPPPMVEPIQYAPIVERQIEPLNDADMDAALRALDSTDFAAVLDQSSGSELGMNSSATRLAVESAATSLSTKVSYMTPAEAVRARARAMFDRRIAPPSSVPTATVFQGQTPSIAQPEELPQLRFDVVAPLSSSTPEIDEAAMDASAVRASIPAGKAANVPDVAEPAVSNDALRELMQSDHLDDGSHRADMMQRFLHSMEQADTKAAVDSAPALPQPMPVVSKPTALMKPGIDFGGARAARTRNQQMFGQPAAVSAADDVEEQVDEVDDDIDDLSEAEDAVDEWTLKFDEDTLDELFERLPEAILEDFEIDCILKRRSDDDARSPIEVIRCIHTRTRRHYVATLVNPDYRDPNLTRLQNVESCFALQMRCVDALPIDGSMVFVAEQCIVRPLDQSLCRTFAATASLARLADLSCTVDSRLRRSDLCAVARDLATAFAALHAEHLAGNSLSFDVNRLSRTMLQRDDNSIEQAAWTLADLSSVRSTIMPTPSAYQFALAAPEIVHAHASGFAALTPCLPVHDSWSLGALLFGLAFNRPMFNSQSEAVSDAVAGLGSDFESITGSSTKLIKWSSRRAHLFDQVHDTAFVSLLNSLLVVRPADARASMLQVLNHPFLLAAGDHDFVGHVGDENMVIEEVPDSPVFAMGSSSEELVQLAQQVVEPAGEPMDSADHVLSADSESQSESVLPVGVADNAASSEELEPGVVVSAPEPLIAEQVVVMVESIEPIQSAVDRPAEPFAPSAVESVVASGPVEMIDIPPPPPPAELAVAVVELPSAPPVVAEAVSVAPMVAPVVPSEANVQQSVHAPAAPAVAPAAAPAASKPASTTIDLRSTSVAAPKSQLPVPKSPAPNDKVKSGCCVIA